MTGLKLTCVSLFVALAALTTDAGAREGVGAQFDSVLGGQMWDKWWLVTGLPEPTGDHPLYPAAGAQSGSTTWRCKECHGWDYKGVDGAYATGSHFTGIKGVFGTTLTSEEMFDLIKLDTPPNGHGFGDTGLTDEEICRLVDFIQGYVIDTDTYIDGSEFLGNQQEGRYNYKVPGGFYNCAQCHGDDGTAINFGTEGSPTYVSDVAVSNPWEFLHKIRFGQPGSTMTSWVLLGETDQKVADIGRYAQEGFPAPDYVGDVSCMACHEDSPTPDFFEAYRNSGHPYKLFRAAGQEPAPGTWPNTDSPPLPVSNGVQLQWSDIEYVIGNYFWKARFVDHDGFIYTGTADETTQWNLATEEFVPYHAGEVGKPYNCGRCHTTGYDPDGNQLGLPGLVGTWTEEGIRCEACHGPGADHVNRPDEMLPTGGKECADCHYRDSQFRMPWSGGFMRHHQQSEDFTHSPHASSLSCNTCHDPHRSTVYDDGGVIAHCTDCHAGNVDNGFYQVAGMESLDCKDCHMPYMGKSAVAFNDYTGDIRGHIFKITDDPIFAVDNTYEVDGKTYWNQTPGGTFITLDYACMGCHMEQGLPLTMEQASAFAFHMHTAHPAGGEPGTMCTGDATLDGMVDVDDVVAVVLAFGGTGGPADVNNDESIDIDDLVVVITNWGPCPLPG